MDVACLSQMKIFMAFLHVATVAIKSLQSLGLSCQQLLSNWRSDPLHYNTFLSLRSSTQHKSKKSSSRIVVSTPRCGRGNGGSIPPLGKILFFLLFLFLFFCFPFPTLFFVRITGDFAQRDWRQALVLSSPFFFFFSWNTFHMSSVTSGRSIYLQLELLLPVVCFNA